jgi:hypothetical protein
VLVRLQRAGGADEWIAAALAFLAGHQPVDGQIAASVDRSLEVGAKNRDLEQLRTAHPEKVTI